MEELSRFVFGCEDVLCAGDVLRFDRLPEGLAAAYREARKNRIRLECPSAVRLRFETDADALAIAWSYGPGARQIYQGALALEDAAPIPLGPDGGQPESWEGTVPLGGRGRHRVELWLPHMVRADLRRLEPAGEGSLTPGAVHYARWLALGDSITQGMETPLPTGTWVARCARALNINVRNYGIGGAKAEVYLAEHPIDWPYDVMSVAYGINDFNQACPLETYTENLRRLVERQAGDHPDAQFIVVTPTRWVGREEDPNELGLRLDDYREAAAKTAAALPRTRVVAGTDLIPDDATLFVDHVHPNTEGMAAYAEAMAPHLVDALPPLRPMVDPEA